MRFEPGSTLMKAVVVTSVALILLIPLHLLRNLVTERTRMRSEAVQQVAKGWGGRQMIGGPVIAIPVTGSDDSGRSILREWYVLPESLDVQAEIAVQDKRRTLGVYEVPVYVTTVRLSGEIDIPREIARLAESHPLLHANIDRAKVLLPVSDPRGLRDIRSDAGGLTSAAFEPTLGFPLAALGAPLRIDETLASGKRRFDITLELAGTEALSVLPLARSTRVRMSGNWPHPGYAQGFLPLEHNSENGRFEARWQILSLNRSFGSGWFQAELSLQDLQSSALGVELVQPVDIYLRTERSVKYAGLFISLSLLTLFMWEHISRRRLHPIQYGLMGLALSVFYLLLLALAEHVGFLAAYAIAAVALCALLGIYLAGAFRDRQSGMAAAGAFAAVYGLLYLLVTSESYALLAGALALFGLLSAVMLMTRKLDWYSVDTGT